MHTLIFVLCCLAQTGHAAHTFFDDFESGELDSKRYRVTWYPIDEGPMPEIVASPVRSGKYAVRFSQKYLWGDNDRSNRVELHTRQVGNGSESGFFKHHGENWIGFSVSLDESWSDDCKPELVFQLHGDRDSGQEPQRSPPLALYVSGGSWHWKIRWDSQRISTAVGGQGSRRVWEAPYVKGKWVDWAIHAQWSHQDDSKGIVGIWKDGEKVAVHNGPNMFNDSQGMKGPQFGIYKWPWLQGPSDVTERIVYFDDIYVTDHTGSLRDVSPVAK